MKEEKNKEIDREMKMTQMPSVKGEIANIKHNDKAKIIDDKQLKIICKGL